MKKALGFLTVVGGPSTPSPDALPWFPIVGALIGLLLGAVWWGAEQLWSPLVAAAIVVAVDLGITGMLHIDGLGDSADGLLPHLPPARRLEVMAEPTIGAFGVAVIGAVLLLRFGALATAAPQPLALAGLWCASRTIMAVVVLRVPYARDQGLASSFRDGSARSRGTAIAALGGALAGSLATVGSGLHGLAAVAGCFVGAVLVVTLARVRIHGFTGDVLGAAGVIGETIGLLVLALR